MGCLSWAPPTWLSRTLISSTTWWVYSIKFGHLSSLAWVTYLIVGKSSDKLHLFTLPFLYYSIIYIWVKLQTSIRKSAISIWFTKYLWNQFGSRKINFHFILVQILVSMKNPPICVWCIALCVTNILHYVMIWYYMDPQISRWKSYRSSIWFSKEMKINYSRTKLMSCSASKD